jgi:hypothetical protein
VETFPRLFSISLQANANIKEMGVWISGVWFWQLKWRRPFFVWEEEVYREFLLLLDVVPISRDKPSWNYRHDIGGLFSVKSNYDFLAPLLLSTSSLPHSLSGVVHKVWDSWAPSKVVVFSWQTLLSRIPTRANLATRGVLLEAGNVSCAVCGGGAESEDHLFLLCPLAWFIWIEVYKWFGVVEVLPGNIVSHFQSILSSLKGGRRPLKGIMMVWQAIIWTIWRARNDKFFSDKSIHFEEVLDKLKCMAWKWLLARKSNSLSLFYEWCANPLDCIVR